MVEFDPGRLTGEASLNRTVIAARPDIRADLHGQTGFALLSSEPVAALPDGDEGAREIGERLAALLTTLRTAPRGDGRGVDATPWRAAYLDWWQGVSEVWLGGGGAARYGPALAEVCGRALRERGDAVAVAVHPHAAVMPLVGAARSARASNRVAVFDFGHTSVKRGHGTFDDQGALAAIELMPPVEVDKSLSGADEIRSFALEVVEETLAAAGATAAAVSVAAYVDADGVVADSRSFYNPLGGADGEPLRAIVRRATGSASDLVLLHDGTAAARAVQTEGGSVAAVTLGTALGVGFLAPGSKLAPLSRTFRVVEA